MLEAASKADFTCLSGASGKRGFLRLSEIYK